MTRAVDLAAMMVRREGPTACLDAAAHALAPTSRLRGAYDTFWALPGGLRRRALNNPVAAARLVAQRLKLKRRAPTSGLPAWGLVTARPDGMLAFAVSGGWAWWAYSDGGVARLHPSRVVIAWEIA